MIVISLVHVRIILRIMVVKKCIASSYIVLGEYMQLKINYTPIAIL